MVSLLPAPQRGSRASSERAWRLRAARHAQGEAGPLGVQPLPRLLEPACCKAADLTASGHERASLPWTMISPHRLGACRREHLDAVARTMDANGDGAVSYDEFVDAVIPPSELQHVRDLERGKVEPFKEAIMGGAPPRGGSSGPTATSLGPGRAKSAGPRGEGAGQAEAEAEAGGQARLAAPADADVTPAPRGTEEEAAGLESSQSQDSAQAREAKQASEARRQQAELANRLHSRRASLGSFSTLFGTDPSPSPSPSPNPSLSPSPSPHPSLSPRPDRRPSPRPSTNPDLNPNQAGARPRAPSSRARTSSPPSSRAAYPTTSGRGRSSRPAASTSRRRRRSPTAPSSRSCSRPTPARRRRSHRRRSSDPASTRASRARSGRAGLTLTRAFNRAQP